MATHGVNSGWIEKRPGSTAGAVLEGTEEAFEHLQESAAEGCRTALSVEFVTKPNLAQRVRAMVPVAINQTFAGVRDFAGCALMVSDQEERLITLLTFWHGRLDGSALADNTRWICKLLEPYMDHRLRVQTLRSQLAILPQAACKTSLETRRVPVA